MNRWPWLRSLRGRVLLAALVLVLIALGTVNLVAWLTVRDSLLDGVDRQLSSIPAGPGPGARGGAAPPAGGTAGVDPDRPQFVVGGPARDDLLANLVVSRLDAARGTLLGQVIGPNQVDEPRPDLAGVRARILAGRAGDQLLTVPGVEDSSYHYRLRILPARNGEVMVVATSLTTVQAAIRRVLLVDLAVSLGVVLGLLGIGMLVMRIGLRPLADVEEAAEQIAAGDLSVRAGHTDEPGEVGSLARSFNRMIVQIDEAFQARRAGEEQLRTFLADVSHELRTPLTTIRAYAELFAHEVLQVPPESRTALDRIESEATRMGALVEDLLTLARLDQHRGLVLEPVDLGPLLQEAVQDVATASPGHAVQLVTAPEDGCAEVLGDAAGLRQVVSNLLTNAVRHTPAGTHVVATLRPGPHEVLVEVADDGPGMTADVAARVFDRFYRPDPGRSRQVAGTGLGLAIVKSQVEAHGGRVTVSSQPHRGARFTVALPAAGSGNDVR